MGELARFLAALMVSAAFGACGWFGRAWFDGSLIPKTEAEIYAQGRADSAAEFGSQLAIIQGEKAQAVARLNSAPKIVSRACPPGLGAVSDDVNERMRAAFQGPKK